MIKKPKAYGIQKLRDTWVVAEPVRKSMKKNRSTGTSPEILLRRALWAAGIRGYRTNYKKLPGKPDIAFVGKKIAIFVHGCFWHGCPTCTRNITPKTNAVYWSAKIEANKARDDANLKKLSEIGFRVVVIWECEIKKDLTGVAERVIQEVRESAD